MATNEMITIDQLTEILNVLPSNTYALVNENGVTKKIKLENLINKTLSEVQVLEIEGVPTTNKTLKGALAELSTQIKENQIILVEDDTSMEGISDTDHDTLTTNNKKIIPAINEVKDIANDKLDKNGILSMANMGQDVKEAMTGGSVAVVGKNTVLEENVVNKQITPCKTSFTQYGNNLLDTDTLIPGYVYSNGSIKDGDYKTTSYIPFTNNDKINLSRMDKPTLNKLMTRRAIRTACFYDSSYNLLSDFYYDNKDSTNESVTYQGKGNVAYIRVSIKSTLIDNAMLYLGEERTEYEKNGVIINKLKLNENLKEEIETKIKIDSNGLKGKTIINFGDSISAGDGNNGVGYAELLAKKNDMTCYDYAVGGATITTSTNDILTQIEKAKNDKKTADYILFDGFTNDINTGAVKELGKISDGYSQTKDTNTFSGAFEEICFRLKSYWKGTPIFYVCVHKMSSRDTELQNTYSTRAKTLCERWSIPVIDIYNEGGLNTYIADYKTLYTNNADGTHPNELGYNTFYVPLIEKNLKGGITSLANIKADNIKIEDVNNNFTSTNVEGALKELFQNVSNGKQLIATAITDKGVTTSSDSTFQTMATNIGNISGGNNSNNGFLTKPIYKEVEGEQYRLIYNEDFDGTDIDRNYWTDSHFISRVEKRYKSWTDYYLKDSILHLRIKEDAPARGGATGDKAVSAIQTGEKNALHITSPVYHDVNPFLGFISQEGYYEARLKFIEGSGTSAGWWTVGVQDNSKQAYEIDIAEILGKSVNVFTHGTHANGDTDLTGLDSYHYTNSPVNLANDFVKIGFLWEKNSLKWYINDSLVDTMNIITPEYPAITFFSCYRVLSGTDNWMGDADTTLGELDFQVDYFKVYKKATTKSTDNVIISNINSISVNIGSVYNIDDDRGCISTMPSYCYVNWSDGTKTEHWVKWDTLNKTKENNITNKTPFTWNGLIHGLGKTATCNVTFNNVSVSSIKITGDDTVLNVDNTLQLTANILPEDATNKNVTWESSDNTKATVVDGLVTAKAEGDVVITCKSVENSSISDTYSISITSTRAVVFELDKDCYSNGIFTDKVANLSSTLSNTTGITTDDNYIYFPQTGKFDFDISSLNLTKKVCLDMVFKFDTSVLSGNQTYNCGEVILLGNGEYSGSFMCQGNNGLFGTLIQGVMNDPIPYSKYTEKGCNITSNGEIRVTFNYNPIAQKYEIYINNVLCNSGNIKKVFNVSKLANSYSTSRDFAGWYKYIRLYNGWLTQDELV